MIVVDGVVFTYEVTGKVHSTNKRKFGYFLSWIKHKHVLTGRVKNNDSRDDNGCFFTKK